MHQENSHRTDEGHEDDGKRFAMEEDNADDLRNRRSHHQQGEARITLREVDRQIDVDQCSGGHRQAEPGEQLRRIAELAAERPDEHALGYESQDQGRSKCRDKRHARTGEQNPLRGSTCRFPYGRFRQQHRGNGRREEQHRLTHEGGSGVDTG